MDVDKVGEAGILSGAAQLLPNSKKQWPRWKSIYINKNNGLYLYAQGVASAMLPSSLTH
jgi:hypothetical protein